jgi:lysophospholipase L1-like esterase
VLLVKRAAIALVVLLAVATGCTEDSPSPVASGDRPKEPATTATPEQERPLPRISRYVALGDSFTAAPFVPEYEQRSGDCVRSTANYPKLVARQLKTTALDRSCSGADSRDLTTGTATRHGNVPPQFAALDRRTDLVTLSMGGNDALVFGTLVTECPTYRDADPTGSPCRDAMRRGGGDRLLTALKQTRRSLAAAISQIRQLAPRARVLVVGYPKLAPDEGTCPDLLPLADGDYAYADELNRGLNQALDGAAKTAGVEFIDVYDASEGHDVCAAEPWVNGEVTITDQALAYHPFAREQRAVAELVLDRLRTPPVAAIPSTP